MKRSLLPLDQEPLERCACLSCILDVTLLKIHGNQDGSVQPVSVKEGEKVLLPPFGGNVVKVGDKEMMLYRDSEILAKLM